MPSRSCASSWEICNDDAEARTIDRRSSIRASRRLGARRRAKSRPRPLDAAILAAARRAAGARPQPIDTREATGGATALVAARRGRDPCRGHRRHAAGHARRQARRAGDGYDGRVRRAGTSRPPPDAATRDGTATRQARASDEARHGAALPPARAAPQRRRAVVAPIATAGPQRNAGSRLPASQADSRCRRAPAAHRRAHRRHRPRSDAPRQHAASAARGACDAGSRFAAPAPTRPPTSPHRSSRRRRRVTRRAQRRRRGSGPAPSRHRQPPRRSRELAAPRCDRRLRHPHRLRKMAAGRAAGQRVRRSARQGADAAPDSGLDCADPPLARRRQASRSGEGARCISRRAHRSREAAAARSARLAPAGEIAIAARGAGGVASAVTD